VVSGSIKGRYAVGGIVGMSRGDIDNCYNAAAISGTTQIGGISGYVVGFSSSGTISTTNCLNDGNITGTGDSIGGIAGEHTNNYANAKAVMYNCGNTGTTRGKTAVGGIVGFNNNIGTNISGLMAGIVVVQNVYNHGAVIATGNKVGGLVGDNTRCNIINSYNTANVTGVGTNVGNLIGVTDENIFYQMENCYRLDTAVPIKAIGSNSSLNYSLTNTEMRNHDFVNVLNDGKSPQAWYQNANEYPLLTFASVTVNTQGKYWMSEGNYDTDWYNETDTVFILNTAAELAGLAKLVHLANSFDEKEIRLGNNIDLSMFEWVPIGGESRPFRGVFDGGNYDISNVHEYNRYDLVGLFGNSEGTLKNIRVVSGTIKGGYVVGGIVGMSRGDIDNCYNAADISGIEQIGGIAGYVAGINNGGTISTSNCLNEGYITSTGKDGYIGGIVGEHTNNFAGTKAVIYNCGNTGIVRGTTRIGGIVGYNNVAGTNGIAIVKNAYNQGSVIGTGYVGGLVGYCNRKAISNSYNTGNVSGSTNVGSLLGYAGTGAYELDNCYYLNSTLQGIGNYSGFKAPLTDAQMKQVGFAKTLNAGQTPKAWCSSEDSYPIFYYQLDFIAGDINGDNNIDDSDLAVMQNLLLNRIMLRGNAHAAADLNNDGDVDILDFLMLKSYFPGITKIS